MPGGMEIWVICGVIVLLFGASAIPKLARNIGKSKGEFERGMREGAESTKTDDKEPTKKIES